MTDKTTRGFLTVATGDEQYYKWAGNLLRSYRLSNHTYPFAIVCDRENEYTKEFDEVFLLKDAQHNYMDKLSVLNDGPYDECIFIETDCLIYRNIDFFFDILSKGTDFSCFGWNEGELSTWFAKPEEVVEKYGVKAIPIFNPGYLFIRQSPVCKQMYRDAVMIAEWIKTEHIEGGKTSLSSKGMVRDDPLLALAMQLNGCICAAKPNVGKCIALPSVKKMLNISLSHQRLDVMTEKKYTDCSLLHFSARRCREEGLYPQQTAVLRMIENRYPKVMVKFVESKVVLSVLQFFKKCQYGFLHRLNQRNKKG